MIGRVLGRINVFLEMGGLVLRPLGVGSKSAEVFPHLLWQHQRPSKPLDPEVELRCPNPSLPHSHSPEAL